VTYPFEYCDDCGEEVKLRDRQPVEQLAFSVTSANAGESATLCPPCAKRQDDLALQALTNYLVFGNN